MTRKNKDVVELIDEENVNQAILEYANREYDKKIDEMFDKYTDEFPEKDWELPDDMWVNNYLAWFLFEKVLPETDMTIAEEFAKNTPDLSPGMKENILQMRDIIRSRFLVISKRGLDLKVKNMEREEVYKVKLRAVSPVYPNSVITDRKSVV